MKREANRQLTHGIGQLLLAGVCAAVIVAGLFGLDGGVLVFTGSISGFFILTLAGIDSILTSFGTRKFH